MKKKLLEITMPVYNEEDELAMHIKKLYSFCKSKLNRYAWHITIVDNASTDNTKNIAKKLASEYREIDLITLKQKGRGRAIKKAWISSDADICSYMDIDLSTDLTHFPDLIRAVSDGSDIAIGTRLLKKSHVINRAIKREAISRIYNALVTLLFQTKFSDAQCGFKAVNRLVVDNLLDKIQDNEWFMDSELLIVGEKSGYKIAEIPVVWRDNPGSTVRVIPTAIGDMRGLMRLFITRPWRRYTKSHAKKTNTRN